MKKTIKKLEYVNKQTGKICKVTDLFFSTVEYRFKGGTERYYVHKETFLKNWDLIVKYDVIV